MSNVNFSSEHDDDKQTQYRATMSKFKEKEFTPLVNIDKMNPQTALMYLKTQRSNTTTKEHSREKDMNTSMNKT